MNFIEELEQVDFQELFDRLTAFVSHALYSVDIRLMDGKEPADLVSDLFTKVLTGQRNPETANCSLNEFLFGCLKSDIDAFFRRNKIRWLPLADETAEINAAGAKVDFMVQEAKDRVITELRRVGADEDEIKVFIVWTEGITKPKKVGMELGLEPGEVYRIQRRIHSHLHKIQMAIKTLV